MQDDDGGLHTEVAFAAVHWPRGHYYTPIPDLEELAREPERSRVRPDRPRATPGIDWRGAEQVALVRDVFAALEPPRFAIGPSRELRPDIGHPSDIGSWAKRATAHHRLTPAGAPARPEYHTGNLMFAALDAWVLQAMLRHVRPKRLIKIGCGWSSLVTASVNVEHLGGGLRTTCIDPSPPRWLHPGVPRISELLVMRAQDFPLERYLELESADVLFIDSSHVAKVGSDVCFLFHEVLPRLAPGVVVHVHDIFLPNEYPERWVADGIAFTEQYVLQSFLACNSSVEILLALAWMRLHHPDVLASAASAWGHQGASSIWMRRSLAA